MEGAGVLEDDADALAGDAVAGLAGDVDAVDADVAGVGAFDAHDEFHHGGFAGAVGADETEDFAGLDGEGHVVDGDEAAEAFGETVDFEQGTHSWCRRKTPRRPRGTKRMARRAAAETMKVLSWPRGRRISPAMMRMTAPTAAPMMVRRPPRTAAMMTWTPTARLMTVLGEAGTEVEDEHGAGETAEKGADDEGGELVLGDVEAEGLGFDRVLAAGLEDESEGGAGEGEEDEAAYGHEA